MVPKKPAERSRAYPKPTARPLDGQIVPVTKRHKVEVVEQKQKLDNAKQDALRCMEDELLTTALTNTAHALNFADIPFETTETPEELIFKHGADADRVFRLMKASQMSAKDAPVGLLLNQRMAASIIKARSAEKTKPSQLNVAIQVVTGAAQFEEKEVE